MIAAGGASLRCAASLGARSSAAPQCVGASDAGGVCRRLCGRGFLPFPISLRRRQCLNKPIRPAPLTAPRIRLPRSSPPANPISHFLDGFECNYCALHCLSNEGDQREPGFPAPNASKCSTINNGINRLSTAAEARLRRLAMLLHLLISSPRCGRRPPRCTRPRNRGAATVPDRRRRGASSRTPVATGPTRPAPPGPPPRAPTGRGSARGPCRRRPCGDNLLKRHEGIRGASRRSLPHPPPPFPTLSRCTHLQGTLFGGRYSARQPEYPPV